VEAQLFSALIATPLYPFAATFLREHGCGVKTVTRGGILMALVKFPAGTTKELRNRAASEHYRLTLPDGISIRQTYDPGTQCSTLALPAQEHWDEGILLPPES
jgi:hypothetical protein